LVEWYFKDSAGRRLPPGRLAFGSGIVDGCKVFEPPPKGAVTLVIRAVPKTTERTYPFEFGEMPARKPEGEQRPSAP
jgi:hypothetical protein